MAKTFGSSATGDFVCPADWGVAVSFARYLQHARGLERRWPVPRTAIVGAVCRLGGLAGQRDTPGGERPSGWCRASSTGSGLESPGVSTGASVASNRPRARLSIVLEWANTRLKGQARAVRLLERLDRQWQGCRAGRHPVTLPAEARAFLASLDPGSSYSSCRASPCRGRTRRNSDGACRRMSTLRSTSLRASSTTP